MLNSFPSEGRSPLPDKLQVLQDRGPPLGGAVLQGSEGRVSSARPVTLKLLSVPEGRARENPQLRVSREASVGSSLFQSQGLRGWLRERS